MSRVFTIQFAFKEKSYTALVSFSTEHSYVVRYLDEEVNSLMPEKKLVFPISESTEYPTVGNRFAQDLITKTREAISGYLQTHEN
jgi:hypothetical protein